MPKGWEEVRRKEIFVTPNWTRKKVIRIYYKDPGKSRRCFWDFYNTGDFIVILALDKQNRVIVIPEFYEAPNTMVKHLITGLIEKGDSPIKTAHKELLEETGYKSDKMVYLGENYHSMRNSFDKCHIFLALECEKSKTPETEEFESIGEPILMKLPEFIEFIKDQKLSGIPDIAAVGASMPYLIELLEKIKTPLK
ncbi:MAG TPA: NUDIX hydrolase [Candidatus Pacearchaeota archaeon]|nr:NUDIX hydrolase [Candidatus Parcubacteria bacterium]HOU45659.1 NUDIX hydrolase [Candidatus Pacearchaeota archaeon]HPM08279.1 NUDIX hydrolase [Candidatus Pacearchaeota archaeon]HQI74588.1 NUDIX hydrolase [Candidatus Pacearchaeota archaeon]